MLLPYRCVFEDNGADPSTGLKPADQTLSPITTPIRAAFCSSRDRQNRVIFDGEYFSFMWWRWKVYSDLTARDDFYAALVAKQKAGVTHVVLDCPNGDPYAGGHNWITELPKWVGADGTLDPLFVAMAQEILKYFMGIFFAYGGGQVDAPNIYNGNLRRMARQISAAGIADRCVNGWAWESCGRDPECTAKQNSDALEVLHAELGASAALFIHVNSSFPQRCTPYPEPYEADCPCPQSPTGEVDVYQYGGFRWLTHFLGQLTADDAGPTPDFEGRLIEILDRLMQAPTKLPGIGTAPWFRDNPSDTRPFPIGPDWLGAHRHLEYVMFEPGIPWGYIRGTVTDATVGYWESQFAKLGIVSRGCLLVVP